jgi:hypothetical protein
MEEKNERTDEMKKSKFLDPNAFLIFRPTRKIKVPGSCQLLRRNIQSSFFILLETLFWPSCSQIRTN